MRHPDPNRDADRLVAMPGIRTPDPTRVPVDPGKPPPLPPGGRLPEDIPPLPDEEDEEDDPGMREPGSRAPPDHLPGGPSNPNPHHATSEQP